MNDLDELIPEAPKLPAVPVILYGEVESVDPLVITVDGDEEPLEIEPSTTVDGILTGDKVAMTLQNDELIVTGIIDGDVDYVVEFMDGIATAHEAIANISEEIHTPVYPPATPGAPTVTDERYLDPFGVWRAKVNASWTAVTQDSNGGALSVQRYELWGQPVVSGTPGLWRGIAASDGTSVSAQSFDIGTAWRFAIVAVSNGRTSARGAYASLTFGVDTTAPGQPAQPGASIYLGAVVVSWSGKDIGGAAMPADFDRCEVHVSTSSGFTSTASTFKGIVPPGGTLTLSGLAAGTTYYIRLVAYDIAGNASSASTQRSATPGRIGYVDLDPTIQTRLTSADGKTTNYYQTTAPTGGTYVVGDTWFDTDDSNRIYRWNGTSWAPVALGSAALSNSAVTAEKLASAVAAEIASKVNADYVASRGLDLVTNGTGLLGNNTNFSTLTFDKADTPVGGGAFDSTLGSASQKLNDEYIPVDLSRRYVFSLYAKQKGASSTAIAYSGILPIDVDKLIVEPKHYMIQPNTTTTLAAALNPGDVKIVLTSAAGWNNAGGTHQRSLIAWNYTDSKGKTWAPETYSRNSWLNLYDAGAISGNEITLRTAWTGPAIPAGTAVSNASSGGSCMYAPLNARLIPKVWTFYESVLLGGAHTNKAVAATTGFPPGTAFVRLAFLPNWADTSGATAADSKHSFAAISFADVTYDASKLVVGTLAVDRLGAGSIAASKLASKTITAESGVIADAAIGNAQIINGAITDAKIANATITNAKISEVDAGKVTTGTLNAARIGANSITADKMSAEDVFTINNYAGPVDGNHTRMTPDGFAAWGPNPDTGAIESFARFGKGLEFGFDPDRPKARIDGSGNASLTSLSTGALSVDGQTLAQILAPLPRGRLAYAEVTSPVTGISTTEVPIIELRANLQPDRLYEIYTMGIAVSGSSADQMVEWTLYVEYDGNPVSTSSTKIRAGARQRLGAATAYVTTPSLSVDLQTAGQVGDREARFLLTAKRYNGTGTIAVWGSNGQPSQMKIRDEGASLAPSSVKIRRTSTWRASTVVQHESTPASNVVIGWWNLWTRLSAKREWVQGIFNGNAISGETGKSLSTALTGANLVKAEILVDIDDGARRPVIGGGGGVALDRPVLIHPSTNTSSNATLPGPYVEAPLIAPPGKLWVDVTSLWTPSSRSAYFSLPSAGAISELEASGDVDEIKLRLTYER